MNNRVLLLLGIAIPLLFGTAIIGLSTLVDGYSHLSQTVSEIGQTDSPAKLYWRITNLGVAVCFLFFSLGIYRFSHANSVSVLPAYFVAWFGLTTIGISIFESPHVLHNVFGLSMTLGYMAPLVLALCWRMNRSLVRLVRFSLAVWILTLVSIALNLSPLISRDLFPLEYYGLVQRSLFLLFHGLWCSVLGLSLYKQSYQDSSTSNINRNTDQPHV
jgi:hypothetical protein